jgi:hypothetical protein
MLGTELRRALVVRLFIYETIMSEAKLIDLTQFFSASGRSRKDGSAPSPEEGLRLIRAFTKIKSPVRRAEAIAIVEQMAQKSSVRSGTKKPPA